MAVTVRKKAGFIAGTLSAAITTTGQTSIDSAAFAALPAVASPEILAIVMDADASAGAPEIIHVTAHTALSTTCTVTRGREGSTARTHVNGTDWTHMPTTRDFIPDPATAGHVLTVVDAQDPPYSFAAPADKVYRIGHTWTIGGTLAVASGDTDFINPFFVDFIAGQSVSVSGYKAIINSGTNVVLDVKKNGTTMTGFDDLTITTTASSAFPGDVALADGDKLTLVVVSVSNTPKNLGFTLFLDYTQ